MTCPKCGSSNFSITPTQNGKIAICQNCGYGGSTALFDNSSTTNNTEVSTAYSASYLSRLPKNSNVIFCPVCGAQYPRQQKRCPECGKLNNKPLYSKWWFWVIIAILIILILPFGNNDSNESKNNDTITSVSTSANKNTSSNIDNKNEPNPEPETKPFEIEVIEDGTYQEGTYKVGVDIEPGEYVLFVTGSVAGYFEITCDSSGNWESITSNENFNYNVIVTIHEGEYIQIKRAYAVPIEKAEIDTSGEGQFKVGLHIEAGEYRVILDGDNAYVEVTENSRHTLDSIKTNDNLSGDSYITVSDGDYLYVKRCHVVKV